MSAVEYRQWLPLPALNAGGYRQWLPVCAAMVAGGYRQWLPPTISIDLLSTYSLTTSALSRGVSPVGPRRSTVIDEHTLTNPHMHVKARELYTAWCAWCASTGETPGSEVTFADAMSRKQYLKRKARGVMSYVGIGLLAPEDAA
jgi:hypothetical protein